MNKKVTQRIGFCLLLALLVGIGLVGPSFAHKDGKDYFLNENHTHGEESVAGEATEEDLDASSNGFLSWLLGFFSPADSSQPEPSASEKDTTSNGKPKCPPDCGAPQ